MKEEKKLYCIYASRCVINYNMFRFASFFCSFFLFRLAYVAIECFVSFFIRFVHFELTLGNSFHSRNTVLSHLVCEQWKHPATRSTLELYEIPSECQTNRHDLIALAINVSDFFLLASHVLFHSVCVLWPVYNAFIFLSPFSMLLYVKMRGKWKIADLAVSWKWIAIEIVAGRKERNEQPTWKPLHCLSFSD